MKRLTLLFLFSYITLTNCGSDSKQDLSGLLLLLAGGPGSSFHCGQTVANPVPYTTTTNQSPASISDFINAAGGNNCGSASLVDNDDGTVTDTQNHFLWTLCTAYKPAGTILLYDYVTSNCNAGGVVTADRDITQAQAVTFCENLNFAGHTDWFLPDAIQLDTLYISTSPFSLTPFGTKESLKRLGVVWTSTQTTDKIIHTYTSGTVAQRYVAVADSTGLASLICVAKL
ncbi:DUF1566 domain-containing protein [Leptospira dzoumogneensis]|uniref:DUF1566 domain-containing protein n=1 Tax=Leptospira dzoumogneensis TaxID=2484904 RepID=A0A4Z1ACQ2_9LEPT|nr:DUF1566 domain-containing protein [Leptospira dzoumogneensis]TGM98610.1 DUF1566 domain-containing protein [Leptospira dzoumogneensis]